MNSYKESLGDLMNNNKPRKGTLTNYGISAPALDCPLNLSA